jgi:hypothetical protein
MNETSIRELKAQQNYRSHVPVHEHDLRLLQVLQNIFHGLTFIPVAPAQCARQIVGRAERKWRDWRDIGQLQLVEHIEYPRHGTVTTTREHFEVGHVFEHLQAEINGKVSHDITIKGKSKKIV